MVTLISQDLSEFALHVRAFLGLPAFALVMVAAPLQMPLLFVASVIGTLGTILSVYKLIHNMFLGQLRVEHEAVREAPLSMLVPMLVLAVRIAAATRRSRPWATRSIDIFAS